MAPGTLIILTNTRGFLGNGPRNPKYSPKGAMTGSWLGMTQWHSFFYLRAKFIEFWEPKWPPFGHLGSDLASSFYLWAQFIEFWELKWPPFSHLGSDLEKVGDVRCGFVQSMILVCFTKWPDGIVLELQTNVCNFGTKMAAIRPFWVGS